MGGPRDHVERLNLGRSVDYVRQGLQHFWVGISVVGFRIGFVLPTD